MSFDDDETAIQGSRPRDAYEFVFPTVTYRLTSSVRDLVVNGQTYRATTIERGPVGPASVDGSPGELEISLVVTHAVAQRCLAPVPQDVDVNVYRAQLTSGEYELAWAGRVVSIRVEDHLAKLLVAQRLGEALSRRLPTISVGRQCSHILYDSACALDRNLFRVDTTIAMVNGRDVTIASIGGKPDDWAQFGELFHIASRERITITSQLGTALQIALPVPMQFGDAVEIYAGCAHDIDTCRTKFANHVNFGGLPDLPATNPFGPNGYAVFRPVY